MVHLSKVVLLLCACLYVRTTVAQKNLNVNAEIASAFPAYVGAPVAPCNELKGICAPTIVTIPNNTLWYWCGFSQTHMTYYNTSVKTNKTTTVYNATLGANVTFTLPYNHSAAIMRYNNFRGCPTQGNNISQCGTVGSSLCDKATKCSKWIMGYAFPTTTCLIVINNNTVPINVSVWVNNSWSEARFNGTVMSIFFTVMFCLLVIAGVSYEIYQYNWGSKRFLVNPHYHPEPSVETALLETESQKKPAASAWSPTVLWAKLFHRERQDHAA